MFMILYLSTFTFLSIDYYIVCYTYTWVIYKYKSLFENELFLYERHPFMKTYIFQVLTTFFFPRYIYYRHTIMNNF